MPDQPPEAIRGRLALLKALAPARTPLLAALTTARLAGAATPAAPAVALSALVARLGEAAAWGAAPRRRRPTPNSRPSYGSRACRSATRARSAPCWTVSNWSVAAWRARTSAAFQDFGR